MSDLDDRVQKQLLGRRKFLGLGMGLAAIPIIGCGDDEENGTSDSNYVTHLKGKTNSSGEVSLGDRIIQVQNDKKSPLAGIEVHAFSDGINSLFEAVDLTGKHYPDFKQMGGATKPTSVNGIGTSVHYLVDQVMFLKDVVGDIQTEVADINHGTFLGSDKNYNKYCMTMDQIVGTSVNVPLGLVLIAAKAAGVKTKVLKNAGTKLLGTALKKYIEAEHGVQSAYEVWVPKTAVSLCGKEYDGVLCPLTEKDLSKIWDPNKPIWFVKGACDYKGPVKACKGGELFCDDFSGSSLDGGKWNVTASDDKIVFNKGVLEVTTSNGASLESKPRFTIGNDTYVFEAKWKLGENSGVDFDIGLSSGKGLDEVVVFNYGYGNNYSSCDNVLAGNVTSQKCDFDVTKWHTTKFEVNKKGVKFYVDGKIRATSNAPQNTNSQLYVFSDMGSDDGKPKKIYFDYVKLIKN